MSRTSDIATVSAIFNGFGYDAVVRDSNLTSPKLRAASEGLSSYKKTNFDFQFFLITGGGMFISAQQALCVKAPFMFHLTV